MMYDVLVMYDDDDLRRVWPAKYTLVGLNSFTIFNACFCLYSLFICFLTETDSTIDITIETVNEFKLIVVHFGCSNGC